MKSLARIGLGLALAITLTAPAGLASTAALATENVPELAEQVEVDQAQAPDVTEAGIVESTSAEHAPAPVPEPALESESEPTPALDPAPESVPQAQFIAPPEEAEPAATDEGEGLENDETAAPVESHEAASTPRAESQPRLPDTPGSSAELLPPNTARFVTFTVTDPSGNPVPAAFVTVRNSNGDHVGTYYSANAAGIVTIASLPYGDYRFRIAPPSGRDDVEARWLDGAPSYDSSDPVTINTANPSFNVQLTAVGAAVPGGVRGWVVDSLTGNPIPGLRLELHINGQVHRSVYTRESGEFDFRNLAAGDYFLVPSSNQAYLPIPRPVRVDTLIEGLAEWELDRRAGESYVPVLVKDRAGGLVQNALVCLHTEAGGQPGAEARCARTSWTGLASLYGGVQYGFTLDHYFIHITPPADTDYLPQWLGGNADPSTATLVDLTLTGVRPYTVTLLQTVTAADDHYTAPTGVSFIVPESSAGVLANDYGEDTLSVSAVQSENVTNAGSSQAMTDRGGIIRMDHLGRFTYTPPAAFAGVDTFTYTMRGVATESGTATATVRITVGDADDDDEEPVVLRNDDYTTAFETLLDRAGECETIGVGANDDGDIKDFVLVDNAAHGSLDFDDKGCFTYLPDAGFSGSDTFTYTVTAGPNSDPSGLTATVTIDVGDEGAPVANDDEYRVKSNVSFIMPEASEGILANDTGLSTLSVYAVLGEPVIPNFSTFTTEGNRLLMSADGTFTFIPEDGFTGTDAVTYTVIDEDGRISEPATVRFIVSSDDGGTAGSGSSDGTLATTGSSATPLEWALGIAALLVTAGALLMNRMRRRLGSSQGQA